MKKETKEVKKVGQVSDKTQAFLDWYNSGLTNVVTFSFQESKQAVSFLGSIKRYIVKHGYKVDVHKASANSQTIILTRIDGGAKYSGYVVFNVSSKNELSLDKAVVVKKGKKNG